MTLKDFCERYDYTEGSVKDHFPIVQKGLFRKYHIKAFKLNENELYIEELEKFIDPRDEDYRLIYMADVEGHSFNINNANLMIVLGLSLHPYELIKGTYADVLKYLTIESTASNIEILKYSILDLLDYNIVSVITIDESNEIILYLTESAKKELMINKGTLEKYFNLQKGGTKVFMRTAYYCFKYWIGATLFVKADINSYIQEELYLLCGSNEKLYKTFKRNTKKIFLAYPEYKNAAGASALKCFEKEKKKKI